MALETSPRPGFLAALFPPGNVAAEIVELRRTILRTREGASALPFPCAAALAWFETCPEPGAMESLAACAPRVHDRFRVADGILYLGPGVQAGPVRIIGTSGSAVPIAAGAGFPLVRLHPDPADPPFLEGLPPAPRIAFRTFQAVLLRLARGDPWFTALAWEALTAVRYPLRGETRA